MSNILVVDDNRDIADDTVEMLAHLGFKVAVAYGGVQCLEKAGNDPPHSVLLDIGMPVMDGV